MSDEFDKLKELLEGSTVLKVEDPRYPELYVGLRHVVPTKRVVLFYMLPISDIGLLALKMS